jgi:ArsR family transcriptional regulator, arsenate/arsenite/antimonite-responsive transcriptional repressor
VASTNLAYEALADTTRRQILDVLSGQGECKASDIAAAVDHVGRTTISSHLRVLRMAGLVNERREGRYRLYSLDPGPAQEVVEFLTKLYSSALTDMKDAAEHPPPDARSGGG